MSASPNSASRLGTKLEIHQGVATTQSNAGAWPHAQVAKKPNRKSGYVNRPADALGIWHPTPPRLSAAVVALLLAGLPLDEGDGRCVARQRRDLLCAPLIEPLEKFFSHPQRQAHMLLPTTRLIPGQWFTPYGAPTDKIRGKRRGADRAPKGGYSMRAKHSLVRSIAQPPIEMINPIIFWTESFAHFASGARKCSFEKSKLNPKNTEFSQPAR
jgi:hypothetical protein